MSRNEESAEVRPVEDRIIQALNAQTRYLHDIRERLFWISIPVWIVVWILVFELVLEV